MSGVNKLAPVIAVLMVLGALFYLHDPTITGLVTFGVDELNITQSTSIPVSEEIEAIQLDAFAAGSGNLSVIYETELTSYTLIETIINGSLNISTCGEACELILPQNGTLRFEVHGNLSLLVQNLELREPLVVLEDGWTMEIQDIELEAPGQHTINLSNYYRGNATFEPFSYDDELITEVDGDILTITAAVPSDQISIWLIAANDSTQVRQSNLFTIKLNPTDDFDPLLQAISQSNETANATPVNISPVTPLIRIGEPVLNTQNVGARFNIHKTAFNITAIDATTNASVEVKEFTGVSAQSISDNKTYELNTTNATIYYYTPGPAKSETEIIAGKKQVTISSPFHYQNILANTPVPDVPRSAIKLFWLTDGTRLPVQDITFIDNNTNGLIDNIEWIVPHLSNQTYELEITVLNIQSYPIVGGYWTVRFTTLGTGNLTISAINTTTYGASYPDDLTPINLTCNQTSLDFNWSGNTATLNEFNCNSTAYWTVSSIPPVCTISSSTLAVSWRTRTTTLPLITIPREVSMSTAQIQHE